MPFEDLLSIKRANLEQLKQVSSNVRLLPAVIEAAKTLPEKAFVEKLNRDHAQHLEVKQPVAMARRWLAMLSGDSRVWSAVLQSR